MTRRGEDGGPAAEPLDGVEPADGGPQAAAGELAGLPAGLPALASLPAAPLLLGWGQGWGGQEAPGQLQE